MKRRTVKKARARLRKVVRSHIRRLLGRHDCASQIGILHHHTKRELHRCQALIGAERFAEVARRLRIKIVEVSP